MDGDGAAEAGAALPDFGGRSRKQVRLSMAEDSGQAQMSGTAVEEQGGDSVVVVESMVGGIVVQSRMGIIKSLDQGGGRVRMMLPSKVAVECGFDQSRTIPIVGGGCILVEPRGTRYTHAASGASWQYHHRHYTAGGFFCLSHSSLFFLFYYRKLKSRIRSNRLSAPKSFPHAR